MQGCGEALVGRAHGAAPSWRSPAGVRWERLRALMAFPSPSKGPVMRSGWLQFLRICGQKTHAAGPLLLREVQRSI